MGALLSSIGRGQENGAGNIGLQLDAGTCAYTTNNTGRKTIGFEDKGSGDYDPGFLDCRFQAGRFNDAGIRETWNLRNNANGIIISGHFFAVLGWFFCIPPIIKYLGGLLLAKLGLLCAVLYGAVQAFAAHLATSARASMPPPEGRRAVIAPSPSRRPSARRGSAGRFGSAPWLARVLFLTLMVGFASAQTCTQTCMYASDGACDDGGPGAKYSYCSLSTDCTDCGPRMSLPAPPLPPPYPPGMAPLPQPASVPPSPSPPGSFSYELQMPPPPPPSPPTPPSPPSRPPAQPPQPAQPGWALEAGNVSVRRRYPPPRDYAHDLRSDGHPTAFEPPNCSAPGRVGCVAMPRPARAKPAPGVRAALLPPACHLSNETGCLRLPKPMARTGGELLGNSEAVIQFLSSELPGGSAYTMSIAAADVDGDGDLDVLLGNDGSPSRVLLNAGDGTFPTSIELPGGSADTRSIAAADVVGDGDLAVLLGKDGSPSRVLLNAGDGTFPTSIELPGGSAPTASIAAADVDGDGDLDVLLGNSGSPSRVLLNAGDGTFPTSIELPGGSASTRSIAAADVDGDGDLDVLLGNQDSPSRVLLNAGDGTFPTSVELLSGGALTDSIAAADVDGDGDLDVLLGNSDRPSRVLLNAGDGTFPTSVEPPYGIALTFSIAAADVDGDGDLDVLLGHWGSPSRVLLNTGSGTFPTSIELPGGSATTISIAAADVDGDGDLDVLLGNNGSPSRVLLNTGGGTFPTSIELPGGSAPTYSIAAADVDGDGDLDVLLGNNGSPSRVLLNTGDGTFPTSIELPGGGASRRSIAAADVDGDGDLDVLLGNKGSPSQVLLNAGGGTFSTSIELPGGSADTYSIAAADVDGDGDLDVLLGNNGSPSRVLLNAGDGTFPTSIELPGGSAPTYSIAAADVDGDGDLDVLLGNDRSPSQVLLNAGDGTFPTSIELPGGRAMTISIAAADVNGDGDLDVLLGTWGSPSRVLLNTGDGTFPTSIELPGGSALTRSIAAADVDGDGDLDVLLGNEDSPSRVLLNAGDGTFPTSITLPGGSALTYSIAAADVDGDGDLDVLLGNKVSVFGQNNPSRLLPFIRCSEPGTARSRYGNGCVRCPAPISRRDDHFDICYECEEHTELDSRGECSSCKPGYDRCLGAAECAACPRGKRQQEAGTLCVDCSPGTYAPFGGLSVCLPCEPGSFCPPGAAVPLPCHEGSNSSAANRARDEQCPQAPPTPPAALVAASHGKILQPQVVAVLIVAALASSAALLIALPVVIACIRQRRKRRRAVTQLLDSNSISMHALSGRVPGLQGERPTSLLESSSVGSNEPSQLEVVDFSTLTMRKPIGKGGFATVWLARWQGNELAVKVLDVEGVAIDASAAYQEVAMLQEVAILRRLRHPCICALFGHMQVEQRPALVLEYMAGGSLAAYLFDPRPASCNVDTPSEAVQSTVSSLNAAWRRFTRASKLPFALDAASAPVVPQASLGRQLMETPTRPHLDDKKIRFGVQLASGLCFLHSHGILHSDVKTDNALLDATHTVCKLADFGLASLSLPNHARRHRGDADRASVGGTVRYLAPERIDALLSVAGGNGRGSSSGSLSLGRTLVNFEDRVDVYAFAFLLWELTHERRAYEGMTGVDAAFGASHGLRPNFSEPSHRHGILFRALTVECWARRPEERPSMSTVLERLEACMQALSATQRSASTEPSLSGRTSSSNFDAAPMANSATTKLACDDFVPYGPAERENTAKVVGHDFFVRCVPADGEHADS
jgi:serine/threonine protein kinase